MLCGVGGRTIEEAQHNMTYAEFLSWCHYRARYGSLNVGMKVDRAVARAMALAVRMVSKNSKLVEVDFSPFDLAAKKEQEANKEPARIEDAFNLLSGLAKREVG